MDNAPFWIFEIQVLKVLKWHVAWAWGLSEFLVFMTHPQISKGHEPKFCFYKFTLISG